MSTNLFKRSQIAHNFLRIRNPLVGIPRETLLEDVELYARQHNLQDILPDLRKGAIVAQNQKGLDAMDELNESEKQAFRDEFQYKWRQPKILYFTVVLNSIAAAIQGWDQTGSNGANLSWPTAFGVPDSPGSVCSAQNSCEHNSLIIGIVNGMPYFAIFVL